jgi:hypothetical protein
MFEVSGGLAEVRTIRMESADKIEFAPHDGELVFGFVLDGSAHLDFGDGQMVGPADAFVIPPDEAWQLSSASSSFRLLQVATSRL